MHNTGLKSNKNTKQERRCTNTITLGCVRVTLLQWKSNNTSITHYECVFVALLIQHAKRLRHIVICGLSGSTVFYHIIS